MSTQKTISQAKSHLSKEAFENFTRWFEEYPLFREEITDLIKTRKWEELEDAFYTHIRVGTGGIRGKLGPGPNRINEQTIGEAAQGLSQFIKEAGKENIQKGVVVGYEARRYSKEFAHISCQIFAANAIRSYLFEDMRSTPEVSFAIRKLGAAAGVQITASHNPRTDNGFKFYWSNGGQVVPPLDGRFMELVRGVKHVKKLDLAKAQSKKLITSIGKEIDTAYLNEINAISLVQNRSSRIVFSPLHGAGITNVLPTLVQNGFDVRVVTKQATPDEMFPTAEGDLINPEYEGVMKLPLELAHKTQSDLALMSDPDADRIGVGAKIRLASRRMQFLSGNEVGAILAHFILTQLKEKGQLHKHKLVITTYVTSSLISDIAKSFDIQAKYDLLVGFKFIADVIEHLENKDDFVFAAEESLGYLYATFVRDKDAAIASFLLAQAASWLKDKGKTLVQYLDELYETYGYYKNILITREMPGKKGFLQKQTIMQGLRAKPPRLLGDFPVKGVRDELPPAQAKPDSYNVGTTGDQITFLLSADERARVTVRPSGTEPKLKYYIQHYHAPGRDLAKTKRIVDRAAEKMAEDILAYA